MFEFYRHWMEFFFLLLMIIGMLIALAAPSAVISYFVIFLSGMIAGRLMYHKKEKIKLPYLTIIGGFIIGYLLGVYYGSRKISIALFVLGAILSYKLYDKKFLKDTWF